MATTFHYDNAVPLNASHVARYATEMTTQLEAMAIASGLNSLAYFLAMAKLEGDRYIRNVAQANDNDGLESASRFL